MRETIKDWKTELIETNGKTDGIEVLISYNSSDEYIYEGSFSNIPEELEAKKVIEYIKVLDSTVPARIGAYLLKIQDI